MEDRKLYHLVNGEFVHNGMPSVHTPTYAEISAHIAILNDVGFFDNPIAESVPAWDGLCNGKRNTEKQASVYDAMMAEIYAERNKAKARRVRKPDNRTRAERLADWDAEKDRRKDIHLDWVERDSRRRYGHGKTHYWDSNAERKICYAESVARADWELESAEIEEYAMWEKFNAELFEFDRQWREQAKAEQERVRKAIEFKEWLKWA